MTRLKIEVKGGRYPHRIIQPSGKHTQLKGMTLSFTSTFFRKWTFSETRWKTWSFNMASTKQSWGKVKRKKRFSSPLPPNSPWQTEVCKNEGNYWWAILIGRFVFHNSTLVANTGISFYKSWAGHTAAALVVVVPIVSLCSILSLREIIFHNRLSFAPLWLCHTSELYNVHL